MPIVTQERGEARSRVICDPERLPIDTKDYEVKKFPERFSNTLYIGLENGVFPEGFAFRIRIYSDKLVDQANVGILDVSMPCFLEIKHPVENVPGARKKLRHQTTIKEAIEIAGSVEKTLEIFGNDLPKPICEKLKLFYKNGKTVSPISGVSYERTHFINGHRLTLDQNIHAFSMVKYDGVWFIKSSDEEPYSMLEIKTGVVTGEANISKFEISKNVVGELVHIEPGMDMRAEGDWLLLERELKIDTVSDPRDGLKALKSNEEISIGAWKEGSSIMQFAIIGDSGICIMGREGVTKKMAIKHKENVASDNGVSTRTERVQPYSKEAFDEIVLSKDGNPEIVERTAYFTRNRAIRLVTCVKTGNVFAITADRCVSEDGRPDLNQTEVEYRGRITSRNDQAIDQEEVNADFQKVSKWLYMEFRKQKLVPQLSEITKYKWSSSNDYEGIGLLEGMKQGNNARIEVDENLGIVKKTYDLWGTIDSSKTIDNYKEFRAAVSSIYKTPNLRSLEIEGDSLKIEEDLIDGVLAKQVLSEGSDEQTVSFIHSVLLPLSNQIMLGKEIILDNDIISKCPLVTPVDIKPDNFVIKPDGEVVFVDMFPPLNRDESDMVVSTYPGKGGKNDALVYGEASVLITRFLMRCIIANSEKAKMMVETIIEDVKKIDSSGFLLDQMQENALREKTIGDFSKVENGVMCLALISAARL